MKKLKLILMSNGPEEMRAMSIRRKPSLLGPKGLIGNGHAGKSVAACIVEMYNKNFRRADKKLDISLIA